MFLRNYFFKKQSGNQFSFIAGSVENTTLKNPSYFPVTTALQSVREGGGRPWMHEVAGHTSQQVGRIPAVSRFWARGEFIQFPILPLAYSNCFRLCKRQESGLC